MASASIKFPPVTSHVAFTLKSKMSINIQPGDVADKVSSHMDSLELIQMVMDCETRFEIKINDAQAEAIETFDDLINIICNAKAIAA